MTMPHAQATRNALKRNKYDLSRPSSGLTGPFSCFGGIKASIDLHQGAIAALACWLAALLAFALHLNDPWWSVI